MTTATAEFTKSQIAHRETCAFLKGILCGYADRCGHTYHSEREREDWTPAFEAGFKMGRDVYYPEDITGIHIAHNQLRHRRPHISEAYDAGRSGCEARSFIKEYFGEDLYPLAQQQAEMNLAEEEAA